VVLRLGLAAVVVAIAGAVVWFEHGQRIDVDTPAVAAFAATAGAVCPDNENVPYGAACISFMQGDAAVPDLHARVIEAKRAPAAPPDATGPACPANNENVPYSANCIRFMSGWFWRLHAP
jgi:hypothetical protein